MDVCVMEAGTDGGADDTMVDLEDAKEEGGADAMVYGYVETDGVCMEVETDGVSYNEGGTLMCLRTRMPSLKVALRIISLKITPEGKLTTFHQ